MTKTPEISDKQATALNFCKRHFVSYDTMRQHVRKNCKIAPNKKNGNTGKEKLAYMRRHNQITAGPNPTTH